MFNDAIKRHLVRFNPAAAFDPPVWHRPGLRTKTGQPLDIPLPTMAVEWRLKLNELACNAEHVLPSRKLQSRMVPLRGRCLQPARPLR